MKHNHAAALGQGSTVRTMAGQICEHDLVALKEHVEAKDGALPAGTLGVVVGVWESDLAYEVEFDDPVQTVLTLRRDQLVAA